MKPKFKLWLVVAYVVVLMIVLFSLLDGPYWISENMQKGAGIWDWLTGRSK